MTEKQFFNAMNRELRTLPTEDKKDILDDYREHFRIGRQEGKSEEKICSSLGYPEDLAEQAKAELGSKDPGDSVAGNVFRVTLASISVILFNAIVMVGPFAGIVGGLAGLWAGAISIFASGVASVIAVPLEPLLRLWIPMSTISGVMPRVAIFFGGIAAAALGALACIGMFYLTRLFIRGTISYARMTWRIITK